jgi:hypothetical protein
MKRTLLFLLPLLALTLFTGCFDILEEVYLEKGGKGKYSYRIDMSTLMSQDMRQMMEGLSQEEGAGELFPEGMQEIDSVITLSDAEPEVVAQLEKPEVFKRSYLKMQISEKKELLIMEFGLDFEEVSEINYFLTHLPKFLNEAGGMDQGLIPSGAGGLFERKGRKLIRNEAPPMLSDVAEEEKQMMMMFMGSGSHKTIYHFPGKVRKTDIPGAEIEGNTVTVTSSMSSMLEGNAQQDGLIKFRWR